MPREPSTEELHRELDGSKAIAFFHAAACPFCQAFAPQFAQAVAGVSGTKIVDVLIDGDDSPLWGEFSIDTVPCVILFNGGQAADRLDAKAGVGLTRQDIDEALERWNLVA